MIRHQDNTNLRIHRGNSYEGLPIMEDKGPFMEWYLFRLRHTMIQALTTHQRTYAFRVDLRLPSNKTELPPDALSNKVIQRFCASFKEKIKHDRNRARRNNSKAHNSDVMFAWAREVGLGGHQHYHLVIFLNQDAYNCIGKYELGRKNNYNRVIESWASALQVLVEKAAGLIHFPDKATYCLDRFDRASQEQFFHRASYLCKQATKVYGDGQHGFGCSRS